MCVLHQTKSECEQNLCTFYILNIIPLPTPNKAAHRLALLVDGTGKNTSSLHTSDNKVRKIILNFVVYFRNRPNGSCGSGSSFGFETKTNTTTRTKTIEESEMRGNSNRCFDWNGILFAEMLIQWCSLSHSFRFHFGLNSVSITTVGIQMLISHFS